MRACGQTSVAPSWMPSLVLTLCSVPGLQPLQLAAAWRSLEPGVRTTPSNSPPAHLSDMSYCSMMHFLVRLTQVGSGFIS